MDECIAPCLCEVKLVHLGDNILIQGAGLQEVDEFIVEKCFRVGGALPFFGQINKENGLYPTLAEK